MPPQKRKHSGQTAKPDARKKAKVAKGASGDAGKPRQHIRMDELAWNEVELPEGLDDYEGFYGLEEIDGIDVVKDESGILSFAIADGVDPESKKRKGGPRNVGDARPDPFPAVIEGADAKLGAEAEVENESEGGEDDGEEFTGFSDDDKDGVDSSSNLQGGLRGQREKPGSDGEDEDGEDDEEDEDDEDEDGEDDEGDDAEDDEDGDDAADDEAETTKLQALLKKMSAENGGLGEDDSDDDDKKFQADFDDDGSDLEFFDENGEAVEPQSKPKGKDATKKKEKASKSANAELDKFLGNGGTFSALHEEAQEEELDTSAWRSLDLVRPTLSALSKLKFTHPTLIQKAAIPRILKGQDVIGKAPTGSGKTMAYGIPIFEHWIDAVSNGTLKADDKDKPQTALILSPTRELAHQIDDHIRTLVTHATEQPPRIATLTGGLSIHKQKRQLTTADIVIATPGRLWELITESKGVLAGLQRIKFLVLDEADRLLSTGHFKEIAHILEALDRKGPEAEADDEVSATEGADFSSKRQTLIFSATFAQSLSRNLSRSTRVSSLTTTDDMSYLIRKINFRTEQPAFVDVNPASAMAPALREAILHVPTGMQKDLYLYTLLLYRPASRILVFVNSISAARRLVPFLTYLGADAACLHSQMPQKARLRAVEKFSSPNPTKKPGATGFVWKGSVLIATDVAARGLDIPHVDVVMHYHVPRAADTYVHRSGRTARAQNEGSSVLICSPDEANGVRRLVAQVHASQKRKRSKEGSLESIHLDRQLVGRLRDRTQLSKTIADAELAKEKQRSKDRDVAEAAEDLGLDLDSDGNEIQGEVAKGRQGRGQGRKIKEKEAREMTKAELRVAKAQLREMLAQRVNTGVSARYLTSGGIDIDRILRERESGVQGSFLGELPELGFKL